MIKELSKNSKLPFSIKTRTGLNEADKKAQSKFIIEASNYCHIISIHGRVTKQIYA
ncbi:tRNA-dihydrouridine synthase [Patescibacteria group bacterium]|nr:tRNA-dihydrouridine synthase [Patescibacteria group bacterium]MBU1758297.1 tRNA-dihydrouridine synthase [Patescibacteria group bacterium]